MHNIWQRAQAVSRLLQAVIVLWSSSSPALTCHRPSVKPSVNELPPSAPITHHLTQLTHWRVLSTFSHYSPKSSFVHPYAFSPRQGPAMPLFVYHQIRWYAQTTSFSASLWPWREAPGDLTDWESGFEWIYWPSPACRRSEAFSYSTASQMLPGTAHESSEVQVSLPYSKTDITRDL